MKHEDLVQKLKTWLGKDGMNFFSDLKKKYNRIDAIWMEGSIPHVVHFREGMQVRNFLKDHTDWNSHELDEKWIGLIEECIKTEGAI